MVLNSAEHPKKWLYEWPTAGLGVSIKYKKRLAHKKSKHQSIEIFDTEAFKKLLVIDQCFMISERFGYIYSEAIAHTGVFSHPSQKAKDIWLIGGGDGGILRELLKHEENEIRSIQMVDIDRTVIELCYENFDDLRLEFEDINTLTLKDKRAKITIEEGSGWIKSQLNKKEKADIVVVDCNDPVGVSSAVFTENFYKDVYESLNPSGMLITQSESPMLHLRTIDDIRDYLLNTGFTSVHTFSFPMPIYPSGVWSATIAYKDEPVLQFREEDAKAFFNQAPQSTRYYTPEVHKASFVMPAYFQRNMIKSNKKV